jgi:hypothetical protein
MNPVFHDPPHRRATMADVTGIDDNTMTPSHERAPR